MKFKELKNKVAKIFLLILVSFFNTNLGTIGLNFHQIDTKGKEPFLYRSSKFIFDIKYLEEFLHKKDLKAFFDEKGIDTVIDMTGPRDSDWRSRREEFFKNNNIKYYYHGYKFKEQLSKEQVLNILDTLDEIKAKNYRTLVYCAAGADRTGLLAAIAQNYLYDIDLNDAIKDSLSWKYWHTARRTHFIEKVLYKYEPYKNAMNFREWVTIYYNQKELDNKY